MATQHQSDDGVIERKVTAEREAEFVVFHIGVRINEFWKIHRWLPLVLIAPRMVRELVDDPESGLLGSRTVVGPGVRHVGFVQYWESFDALREYARDDDRLHFPAWQEYYRSGTKKDTAVGIWHETYLVRAGEYETVYNNMPPHGLAACDGTEIVSAGGRRETASGRLGHPDGTDSAVGTSETN
ncbi:DUF4188 domain-containing protein [Natronococcus pandeyae]|uniref:DUF4188 domain-containing protein n=1 Tax=Natronococcus pandeyae TaxID=2055836 RepID=A0A8J8TRJ0_9EURY|nr:DUF4188 domain-containing protein [Natronococcus pandeyae]TYL38020.1 DUF4188 domain-containing protein [Natronococcus pandeyae]